MENTNMGTGYCTHRLHSNSNRGTLIIPEEYANKADDFMKILSGIESKRKDSPGYELLKKNADDILYFTMCMDLTRDDVKYKKGIEKENAIKHKEFFQKILESI